MVNVDLFVPFLSAADAVSCPRCGRRSRVPFFGRRLLPGRRAQALRDPPLSRYRALSSGSCRSFSLFAARCGSRPSWAHGPHPAPIEAVPAERLPGYGATLRRFRLPRCGYTCLRAARCKERAAERASPEAEHRPGSCSVIYITICIVTRPLPHQLFHRFETFGSVRCFHLIPALPHR